MTAVSFQVYKEAAVTIAELTPSTLSFTVASAGQTTSIHPPTTHAIRDGDKSEDRREVKGAAGGGTESAPGLASWQLVSRSSVVGTAGFLTIATHPADLTKRNSWRRLRRSLAPIQDKLTKSHHPIHPVEAS